MRVFLPAPLPVVEPLWLRFSQLGDGFDAPPGAWDDSERAVDGGVLRAILRPRLRWTFECRAPPERHHVLVLEVRIMKGRTLLETLHGCEAIAEAGFQTARAASGRWSAAEPSPSSRGPASPRA